MTVQVKICGITTREAADAAVRAGADFAGLVFYRKSPRNLDLEQAQALAHALRGRTRIVALFADASDYDIEPVVRNVRPDLLQLHGGESHMRVAAISAKFGLPVINVLGIAEDGDVAHAHEYEAAAEYLMFDAKNAGSERPGGIGAAFDWKILAGRTFKRPWFLAGGLNADNVARAIQVSGAQMVDASSGLEDAPGVKNPDKIAAFVAAARNAHRLPAST